MATYKLNTVTKKSPTSVLSRFGVVTMSLAAVLLLAGLTFVPSSKAHAFRGGLNNGTLQAGACATMIPNNQTLSATSGTFTIGASVTSCSTGDENIAVDWLDATSGLSNACTPYAQQNSGSLALKSGETKGTSITLPLSCVHNTTFHGFIGSNGVLLFQNDYSYYIK